MTTGWRLEFMPPARRDLRRLDPPIRQRIHDALDQLVVVVLRIQPRGRAYRD